jgi:hypothetical protein
MAGREDFRRPGRPGHAAHPEHSPTPEVSSGSLASGRPRLAALARSTDLQCWSVGQSFGMTVVPTTLGRPPRRSSAFFSFFILPLEMAVKYVLIYIYTHIGILLG